ncbi:unnamed protein product [Tenebrio molitor]|nr:unnamed protein product [Tenebrio molitor]
MFGDPCGLSSIRSITICARYTLQASTSLSRNDQEERPSGWLLSWTMIMLYEQKTYSRLMQKDEDHDDIDVENDKF